MGVRDAFRTNTIFDIRLHKVKKKLWFGAKTLQSCINIFYFNLSLTEFVHLDKFKFRN